MRVHVRVGDFYMREGRQETTRIGKNGNEKQFVNKRSQEQMKIWVWG